MNRTLGQLPRGRRRKAGLSIEFLEGRIAPAGILNGDFAIGNPANPQFGYTLRGDAVVAGGQGVLNEGSVIQSGISQTFTILPGASTVQFTVIANNLVSNGLGNPPDAFEAALLDAATLLPLVGPATGLTSTDAFLNIQQTGEVYYAPGVAVPGAGASGQVANLAYPLIVTVDVSGIAAGVEATIHFDLIGFTPATSSIWIDDLIQYGPGLPPALTFSLSPASDSGVSGDNLTNITPVTLIGVTNPNQDVDLDIGDDGTVDATATADASGSYSFPNISLVGGSNLFQATVSNGAGETTSRLTITLDTAPPTGALITPAPGSTTNQNLGYVDVKWTKTGPAAIDPASFDANDVTITGVAVYQAVDQGNGLVRYLYSGSLAPGVVTVNMVAGQVADAAGNTNPGGLAMFTVTGGPQDLPPTTVDDHYTVIADTTLTVAAPGVLINDVDPNPGATLAAAILTQPAHGQVALQADGSFVYTPAASFIGTDAFTYRARSGSVDGNPATVSISVVGRPVAAPQTVVTTLDAPRTITLTATDPNAPPLPLTYQITVNPTHGVLSGSIPNVVYTPTAGYTGPDAFQFTASNGIATSAPATVAITVNPAPQPPVAKDDVYAATAGQTLRVAAPGVLINDENPNPGVALRAVLASGPQHGSLQLNADGSFVYTPAAAFQGVDVFTYRASAGALESNPATVTITVAAAPVDLSSLTPYVRALLNRRSLNPARFDFHHPTIGPLLAAVQAGERPTSPYYLALARRRALNPGRFDHYHPNAGPLLALIETLPEPASASTSNPAGVRSDALGLGRPRVARANGPAGVGGSLVTASMIRAGASSSTPPLIPFVAPTAEVAELPAAFRDRPWTRWAGRRPS